MTAAALADAHAATAALPDAATLKKMQARFAPVELGADVSVLPENERRALAFILRAAQLMDGLYLGQVWAGNNQVLLNLLADTTPLGKARLDYFLLNKGGWSRLDEQLAFLPGVPAKPAGGNFYPAGATKAELEAWHKTLNDADRAKAQGFFTTIRRLPSGKLTSVSYAVEYQGELELCASYLRQAAALTTQPTLKTFLEARAAALLSNDYYASDVAWMELDASIEPTLGPYEVYEDEWFNAKAAFEAFITLRDDVETAKLEKFSAELQDIENHLPIDDALKNKKLGAMAPIRVVNSLFSAGDANRAVQTAAFNLPNDERIAKEKGTKRVMLKNVQEAKFNKVLLPIAKVALSGADQKNVAFDAFFTHILMHELMHGLGPHTIKVGAGKTVRESTVRAELQDTYSAIEEAKADVSGLWAMQYLIDKGVLAKDYERTMYTTYLASMFRSIRFGINEAHGKGVALQLSYFVKEGGVSVGKGGTFAIDAARIKQAVQKLTTELMNLQAKGDKKGAEALIGDFANLSDETRAILKKLEKVPTDIQPRYLVADKLLQEYGEVAATETAGK